MPAFLVTPVMRKQKGKSRASLRHRLVTGGGKRELCTATWLYTIITSSSSSASLPPKTRTCSISSDEQKREKIVEQKTKAERRCPSPLPSPSSASFFTYCVCTCRKAGNSKIWGGDIFTHKLKGERAAWPLVLPFLSPSLEETRLWDGLGLGPGVKCVSSAPRQSHTPSLFFFFWA